MTKGAQHTIGKLIKHAGLDNALVETRNFGIKITKSVTSWRYYDRSI